jgi:hypothetical protein
LIKDYDLEVHYHPGKANVVANVAEPTWITLAQVRWSFLER